MRFLKSSWNYSVRQTRPKITSKERARTGSMVVYLQFLTPTPSGFQNLNDITLIIQNWSLSTLFPNIFYYSSFIATTSNLFNSHAVGMVVARPYGFEIDFVRNPIFQSGTWFFVNILKFILTSFFEIRTHEKNSLTPKNFILKARFS